MAGKGAGRVDRRADLLVAAGRCFVAKGLRATTMEDVARTAGAGKATLYRHFANKDALIDALLIQEGERLRRDVDAAVAASETAVARVEAAFVTSVAFLVEHPLLRRRRDTDPDVLLKRIIAGEGPLVRAALDSFAELIEVGVRAGEIRPDAQPRAVAEVLVRLVFSYVTIAPLDVRVDDPEARIAFARMIITGGLRVA